jgi:16S rRNA (guanine527-N7)-methyltransferase
MSQLPEGEERAKADLVDHVGPILKRSALLGFLGGMAIDEQIDHALGFRRAVEARLSGPPTSALDLGSGGGIPGLVLAAVWPASQWVFLDASERRTDFLREEVETWGVSERVNVVRGRAEEMGRAPTLRGAFDVVTARSFGSPAVTAECGAPFLRLGGLLVVSEPPNVDPTERWPVEGLAMVGLVPSSSYRHEGRFGFQVMEKQVETPERFPRRTGIPAKRQLF